MAGTCRNPRGTNAGASERILDGISSEVSKNTHNGNLNRNQRRPAVMVVYDGQRAIGEIEDHGPRNILAFDLSPTGRVALGQFPDRRAAIRAVSVLHPPVPRVRERGAP
jgi:hypothetical protein